jgi:hypothetical protein
MAAVPKSPTTTKKKLLPKTCSRIMGSDLNPMPYAEFQDVRVKSARYLELQVQRAYGVPITWVYKYKRYLKSESLVQGYICNNDDHTLGNIVLKM